MKLFLLCLLFFLLIPSKVNAIYNPLILPNNKFGIHILSENDISAAAALVNSAGGDWGYVTVVMRDDERDEKRWNNFFADLQQNHLIPIVRLATHLENNSWRVPSMDEAEKWADFLDNLSWPIQNRYIIFFNEPNHAKEWGGKVNPQEYALVLEKFITTFKNKNKDFFVLPAGLDLAAPQANQTIDVYTYMTLMNRAVPRIFTLLDGWSSHSYPNPNFASKPDRTGRISIRGFEWELLVLRERFGVREDIPVFITETGWARSEQLTPGEIAENYRTAFTQIWTHRQIVAVTPFLLRYDESLFAPFSFAIPKAEAAYYPQYDTIKILPKLAGYPLGLQKTPLGKLVEKDLLRRYSKVNTNND